MSTPETTQRPSAGRPLGRATVVGLTMLGVLIACLLLPSYVFTALVVVGIIVGLWEIRRVLLGAGYSIPTVAIVGAAVILPACAYQYGVEGLVLGLLCLVPVVLAWRLLQGGDNAVRDALASVLIVTWIPFLASFLVVLVQSDNGPAKVLTAVLITSASDTGGYLVGVLIGRHPMAPAVSPKKSWEGFAGSIVLGLICAFICFIYLLHAPWWVALVAGILGACTATVGDLGESLIKRDLQIKDMGQILPGHGGLLDRVDSLLATAPLIWLIITVFLGS